MITYPYSVWSNGRGEFTLVQGTDRPAWDTPGLNLVKVFQAESWEDDCRQYHGWQGWGPYVPMDDDGQMVGNAEPDSL